MLGWEHYKTWVQLAFKNESKKCKKNVAKKKKGGGQGDLHDIGVDKGFSVTLKAKSI